MGESRQRGRPPHPDVLTPREWEVLGLLREGLTNRQIGERLGVTQDAAKYHVGQILSKLGVNTREEAAEWQSQALEPAEPVRLGMLTRALSGLPIAAKGVLVAASAAALTGVGVLGWGVATGGSAGDGADQTVDAAEGLGKIAFVGGGDLWTLDIDSGEETALALRGRNETFGAGSEDMRIDRPRWSPDGRFIAYHLRSDGEVEFDLNQVTVVGGEIVASGGYSDAYYEWARQGSRIGFGALAVEEVLEQRYVTTAAGDPSPVPRISASTFLGEGEFRWSPDGKTAVVSVLDPAAGAAKLLIADPDQFVPGPTPGTPELTAGASLLVATPGVAAPYRLHSWSPGGRYIAAWPPGDGESLVPLQVIDLAEGGMVEVGFARPEQDSASWSPDGSAIAVVSGREFQDEADVVVFAPEGEELWRIERATESSSQPAWSDDGSRIAFVAAPEGLYGIPDAHTRIWSIEGSGINARPLTDDERYMDRYPQWSADGTHIMFVRVPVAEGEVAPELWLVRSDGSEARRLVSLPAMAAEEALYFDDWDVLFDWYRGDGEAAGTTLSPSLDNEGVGSATAMPTPSATAGDFPGLAVGAPIDFPEDVALIIETGCTGCEGPAQSLIRVYRKPDGTIAQDVLFNTARLGLPTSEGEPDPYIAGHASRPDASEIVVVVCTRFYCGGIGYADEDAEAIAYRSLDGGVTWHEWFDWPLNHWMLGFVDGEVLAGHVANPIDSVTPPEDYRPQYRFVLLPSGRDVVPPPSSRAGAGSGEYQGPLVTDGGEILWLDTDGQLVDQENRVLLALPQPVDRVIRVAGNRRDGLLVWLEQIAGPNNPAVFAIYEPAGNTSQLVNSGTYEVGDWGMYSGAWIPSARLLYSNVLFGRMPAPLPTQISYVELVPAVIDFGAGSAHPIIEPFTSTSIEPNPRNRVNAVQFGPFARVTGTESCLNLRSEPSTGAQSLECLADGVLLRELGPTVQAEDQVWVKLQSPSGQHGYASAAFLER